MARKPLIINVVQIETAEVGPKCVILSSIELLKMAVPMLMGLGGAAVIALIRLSATHEALYHYHRWE
jgi:hypothetical protein